VPLRLRLLIVVHGLFPDAVPFCSAVVRALLRCGTRSVVAVASIGFVCCRCHWVVTGLLAFVAGLFVMPFVRLFCSFAVVWCAVCSLPLLLFAFWVRAVLCRLRVTGCSPSPHWLVLLRSFGSGLLLGTLLLPFGLFVPFYVAVRYPGLSAFVLCLRWLFTFCFGLFLLFFAFRILPALRLFPLRFALPVTVYRVWFVLPRPLLRCLRYCLARFLFAFVALPFVVCRAYVAPPCRCCLLRFAFVAFLRVFCR